jgi:plasmid maintenance system antidote protein VapI
MPNLKKMYATQGKQMPHAGQLLNEIMLKKHVSKAELARQLGISPIGINRYIQQQTLHAALLWKIGLIVKYNFFAQLAAEFPSVETPEEMQQKQLQEKLQQLQKENEIYQKMLGK